jgi:hypothetical protein
MKKIISCVLGGVSLILIYCLTAAAQDTCAEIGQGCRKMTEKASRAFGKKLLAVRALLPIPDAALYEEDIV